LPRYVTIIGQQKTTNQKAIITACTNVVDDVLHQANYRHGRLVAQTPRGAEDGIRNVAAASFRSMFRIHQYLWSIKSNS
jgi:hypothetical protein